MATPQDFDAFWDEWVSDIEGYPDPLDGLADLGRWSGRQHALRMGRESFLRAYHGTDLVEALSDALTRASGPYSPNRIRSEVIGNHPELLDLFDKHQGPQQAELDLHLEGNGVRGHTTDAKRFVDFVGRLTQAVASASKADQEHSRARSGLLIEGAAPGSVRVVLKSAEAFVSLPRFKDMDPLFEERQRDTRDSVALREVANALIGASSADTIDDPTLGNALLRLPASAHGPLKSAVETVISADWEIRGLVRQRGIGRREVRLTRRGADRLKTALSPMGHSDETIQVDALLDGFKISESRIWLLQKDQIRALPVVVPTSDLLRDVFDLVHDGVTGERIPVKATIKVTRNHSTSSGKVLSTARELIGILPAT